MNLKNKTYRDLWTGDFDNDGTPNIDDSKPFDKKDKNKVNHEISLSQAYKDVENRREIYKKDIEPLKIKLKTCNGRVKDQYSSIGKQLGRNIITLEDMGGIRILKDKRKDVYKEVKKIKKQFPKCTKKRKDNCIKEVDNKYNSAKKENYRNPYLAVHVNLKYKGKPYEVQVKTEKMQPLTDMIHGCYKNNDFKCMGRIKKEVKRLYKKGY